MDFFKKTRCDRCHSSLDGGRICSMFNEQTICMTCKEKEQQRADYRKAVEADHAEIRKGNYNFQGSAWTTERKCGGGNAPQPKGKHHGKGY